MSAFSGSPTSLVVSSTGNVVTFSGTFTGPFTLSGGYTASITSQTSTTATISAGSVPSILTVTDSLGNTCLLPVSSAGANGVFFVDNFVRANSASLGNGWIDPTSKGSIASNTGNVTVVSSGFNGSGLVYRPLSDGNSQYQEMILTLPAGGLGTGTNPSTPFILTRLTYTNTSTTTEYLLGFSSGVLTMFKWDGTTLTSIGSGSAFTYDKTAIYSIQTIASGASPTTLTISLFNLTTGATVTTLTRTDSTAGLQISNGEFGLTSRSSGTAAPLIMTGFASLGNLPAATNYTLTGPSSGGVGVPSSNFTVSLNAHSSSGVTITPSDGGGGGTFTPSTVSLSTATQSATFTYTAPSGGSYTVSTTNSGSLTDPSPVSYSAAVATALTLTGPSSGLQFTASTNFTVALSPSGGSIAGTAIVTPSDGGVGGTFTPTTVSLSTAIQSATFTYTPATTGAISISLGNNAGLTNPSPLTYTVSASVGVTSPAFRFSPANWAGNSGRGGSLYRRTWCNGAYFEFVWTASSSPTLTILIPTTATGSFLRCYLNGVLQSQVAATGNVTITGIAASASNTLRVIVDNSPNSSRWNGDINTVKIQGIVLDASSVEGTAPTYSKWVMFWGDSITEGINAGPSNVSSNIYDYSFLVGQALLDQGFDYCVSACGSNGYLTLGAAGNVPAFYRVVSGVYQTSSRWNLIDQGVSLLDSNGQISSYGSVNTTPAATYVNFGTNEWGQGSSTTDLRASITACLVALRTAAPNAYNLIQMPFGLRNVANYAGNGPYITAIAGGVSDYLSSHTDSKASLIDYGLNFANTVQNGIYVSSVVVHPSPAGHGYIAPRVMGSLISRIAVSSVKVFQTLFIRR